MRNILFSILLSVPVLMLLVAQEGKNEVVKTSDLRMTQIAGYELFQRKNCNECHTLGSKQEGERTPIAEKRSDAWFQEHVDAETELVLDEAASRRKKRRILKNEIDALDDFLFGSKPAEKQRVLGLPRRSRPICPPSLTRRATVSGISKTSTIRRSSRRNRQCRLLAKSCPQRISQGSSITS